MAVPVCSSPYVFQSRLTSPTKLSLPSFILLWFRQQALISVCGGNGLITYQMSVIQLSPGTPFNYPW